MPFLAGLAEAIDAAVTALAATDIGQAAGTAMDVYSVATDPSKVASGVGELKNASTLDSGSAWTAAKTAYRAHGVVGSAEDLKNKATGNKNGRDNEDDPMSSALSHLSSSEGPTYRHSNDSDATLVEPPSPGASKNSPEYSSKAEQDPDIGDVDYQHNSGSGNMRV